MNWKESLQLKQTEKAISFGNNCAEAWAQSPITILSAHNRGEQASWLQFPALKWAIFPRLLLTFIQIYNVRTLNSWILCGSQWQFCACMSVVVSKGTIRVKEEWPSVPQLPSQKRFNLPKETQNPYGVLASWRNQFGTGFRDWLTCTVVWVLSWQPQLSTLSQPKKIRLILKNMKTHFVIVTIVPVPGWSNQRKFPLTFTAH